MSQSAVLHVPSEVTVWKAQEVKELFVDALRGADRVEVDLSALTTLDVAFLQLLLAAQKAALRDGKVIAFPAGKHSAVAEMAIQLGFAAPTDASEQWPW